MELDARRRKQPSGVEWVCSDVHAYVAHHDIDCARAGVDQSVERGRGINIVWGSGSVPRLLQINFNLVGFVELCARRMVLGIHGS
jgi:hypothetical protein